MKLAALDLGSNSFHLVLGTSDPAGGLSCVDAGKEMVKLGAGTLQTGVLDPAAWSRGMDAVDRLVARAREQGAQRVLAVATSVLRESKNGREFAAEVRARHDVRIDILDSAEEARLIYLAARSTLPSSLGRIAVVDVGGGSVVITLGDGRACQFAWSLPLGVLRLRETLVPADGYVSERTAAGIADAVRAAAAGAARAAATFAPKSLVFTSGTARTVARLAHQLGDGANDPERLARHEVTRLAAILCKFKPSGLDALGVEEGRFDTIAPGTIAVETIMDVLRFDSAHVSARALRHGVLVREVSSWRACAPADWPGAGYPCP